MKTLITLLISFQFILSTPSALANQRNRTCVDQLLSYTGPYSASEVPSLDRWLIDAHPNLVTPQDLENRAELLNQLVERSHLIDGVIFPRRAQVENGEVTEVVDPRADLAMYQGFTLAAFVFKYKVTRKYSDLKTLARVVDGVYKLTQISGTPGALVRYALPLELAQGPSGERISVEHKDYPFLHVYYTAESPEVPGFAHLQNVRAKAGQNVRKSPAALLLEPDVPYYSSAYFKTRTSRDQLAGIAFGLASALKHLGSLTPRSNQEAELLGAVLKAARMSVRDIYHHLADNEFNFRDPLNKQTQGNAHDVAGMMRVAMDLLLRHVVLLGPVDGEETWHRDRALLEQVLGENLQPDDIGFFRKKIYQAEWLGSAKLSNEYYAWNLRTANFATILLMDDIVEPQGKSWLPMRVLHAASQEAVSARNREWLDLWSDAFFYIGPHANVWFTYLYNYANRTVLEREGEANEFTPDGLARAHFHLRSMALRPVRSYASPAGRLGEKAKCLQTHRPESVFPPHLTKFSDWSFEKDWRNMPPAGTAVASETRIMTDYLAAYWFARVTGFLNQDFNQFPDSEYDPRGNCPEL
jgi:hypothetical protein